MVVDHKYGAGERHAEAPERVAREADAEGEVWVQRDQDESDCGGGVGGDDGGGDGEEVEGGLGAEGRFVGFGDADYRDRERDGERGDGVDDPEREGEIDGPGAPVRDADDDEGFDERGEPDGDGAEEEGVY